DSMQGVQALVDGVEQSRPVAVIEILYLRHQLVPVIGKAGVQFDLVVECANGSFVVGQQPDDKLFGGGFQQGYRARHAAARIEHHDRGDREVFAVKDDQ